MTGVTFKPGKEREIFHGEGGEAGTEVMAKDMTLPVDSEQAQLAQIMQQNQRVFGKLKPAALVAMAKESR